MRLMSFAMTTPQIMSRTKTVTRRLGWRSLKPGQLLLAVDRCMGFAAGEHPTPLSVLCVASVRRERLDDIGFAHHARNEVRREGFELSAHEFVSMFCKAMACTAETEITRIEFQYVPGGRSAVKGFCRVCGCSELAACWDEVKGSCWWVNDQGRAVIDQTSLCSHCFNLNLNRRESNAGTDTRGG